MNCDCQGVLVSTADLLYELVLKGTYHSGVLDFLGYWLLSEVCIRVLPELSLAVRTPRVDNPMNVPLVDASILSAHDA